MNTSEQIEKIIRENVPKEEDRQVFQRLLGYLIASGSNWFTNEEAKKGIRKFRASLRKAIEIRDTFSVEVQGKTDFPLQRLFGESVGAGNQHGPDYWLKHMIGTCDLILGKQEPARYPRQRVILETLKLWKLYTGKPILPTASVPSRRVRKQRTPPYKLCGFVLQHIERKPPGDFSFIYNTIAGSKTFQK